MNKADLVREIAEITELTNAKADEALVAILDTITEALSAKDKLILIGFGTFDTANRAARTGRNPKTGEEIKIKASVAAKFKPGKALKEAVAGKKPVSKESKTTTKVNQKADTSKKPKSKKK